MSEKVKLLAFSGSLRKGSFNKKIAKVVASGAEAAGAEVTLLDLADYPLPLFDEDLEAASGLPDNAKAIKKLMIESDGFIVASPEYNSSITAALKNAIDWASRKEGNEAPLAAFKDKTGLLVSASPGALGGLRGLVHVRSIFSSIGMNLLADQHAVGKAHDLFGENDEITDEATKERLMGMGEKLANHTALLKQKSLS